MLIKEIFLSIQGESTRAGLPCVFVRLSGCNLGCTWCDTAYARRPGSGTELSINEIIKRVARYNVKLVEITGGEPLIQPDTKKLLKALVKRGLDVLLETNGSISLKGVDRKVIKVVDVKCPSSGHAGTFVTENIALLGKRDELKFVVADKRDYEFAKEFIEKNIERNEMEIIFSPVAGKLKPARLAAWMLDDRLSARLQVQLHKIIWPSGVEGDKRKRRPARVKPRKARA